MLASVHIVTQEEVVAIIDVARVRVGRPKGLEEALQVGKLSVDITKDFEWRLDADQCRGCPHSPLNAQPAHGQQLIVGADVLEGAFACAECSEG